VEKRKRTLLLITSGYPYQDMETFLEPEIEFLAEQFDKVFIIIPYHIDGEPTREIPDNAKVVFINCKTSMLDKVLGIGLLLTKTFRTELYNMKRYYSIKRGLSVIKILLNTLIEGKAFSKSLDLWITQQSLRTDDLLIYSYWLDTFTYGITRLKASDPRIKIFSRCHRWDLYFEVNAFNYLPLRQAIFKGLDAIYPISDHGTEYLSNKLPFVDHTKLLTQRLGTEAADFKEKVSKSDVLTIYSISYLIRVKHVELLVEALSLIDNCKVCWYHIGEGPSDEFCIKDLAHELLSAKENISYEFIGDILNKEVFSFLKDRSVDLLVNLSDSEGIPVSMMEAMSLGIPVVATDVGGVSEIVNNENGVLLPATPKSKEVSRSIEKFGDMDISEYNALQRAAYKTWEQKYTAASVYPKFVREIASL